MSAARRKPSRASSPKIFAALGDPTRLRVVTRLAHSHHCSLSQLTNGAKISRQGMTKHLRVLEQAGLLRSIRVGREKRFELNPEPLSALRNVLDQLSAEWDNALSRLKLLVED